jgi:hypothetical protein
MREKNTKISRLVFLHPRMFVSDYVRVLLETLKILNFCKDSLLPSYIAEYLLIHAL